MSTHGTSVQRACFADLLLDTECELQAGQDRRAHSSMIRDRARISKFG